MAFLECARCIKSNSFYENGKKEGLEYLYDKEGRTLSKSNFSLGLLDGIYIEYYELFRPALVGFYKQGKKDSVWTEYFPFGEISYTQNFKLNLQHGLQTHYYPNQEISRLEYYTYGIKSDQWTYYHYQWSHK